RVARRGLALLGLLLVGGFAGQLAPRDPLRVVAGDRLKAPGALLRDGRIAVLGTDGVGRDVLSRIITGTRLSLLIGLSSVGVARGIVLSIKEREYVLAAVVGGASSARILLRHVLPNALNPVMILASLHLGQMIIAEASLSYLGLGIQPPAISWGGMIADGRSYL